MTDTLGDGKNHELGVRFHGKLLAGASVWGMGKVTGRSHRPWVQTLALPGPSRGGRLKIEAQYYVLPRHLVKLEGP